MHPLLWALAVVVGVALVGCAVVMYACCRVAAAADREAGYDMAAERAADEEEALRYGA
jgi:hypothetical protein